MSITQSEKAKRFRALHQLPATVEARIEAGRIGAFIIPNPWDAGSARILAGLGFQALATTSAGFAFSLGRHDGTLTRDDVLAHCRAIVEATDLPVAADLENCFGDDPKTVAETIRLAAATGIVGGSVEDASGDDRHPIYDHTLAVERVAAAVEAARALPFPFTLTARAENFLCERRDLDDTIRRLQAFAQAGAEVLYAPGLPDQYGRRARTRRSGWSAGRGERDARKRDFYLRRADRVDGRGRRFHGGEEKSGGKGVGIAGERETHRTDTKNPEKATYAETGESCLRH